MIKYVGIEIHTVYGISGNELPPPVDEVNKTAWILHTENRQEAFQMMADIVLPKRAAEQRKFVAPCHVHDGYDWEIVELADNNL
jgi:hypothetical protein